MTKKHRKKIAPPPLPRNPRYTLYLRDASGDILFWVVMLFFFAIGIGIVFEK
jgi:hypothetical protein